MCVYHMQFRRIVALFGDCDGGRTIYLRATTMCGCRTSRNVNGVSKRANNIIDLVENNAILQKSEHISYQMWYKSDRFGKESCIFHCRKAEAT